MNNIPLIVDSEIRYLVANMQLIFISTFNQELEFAFTSGGGTAIGYQPQVSITAGAFCFVSGYRDFYNNPSL